MIVGIVRAREPLIRLTIRGLRGRQQEIEAVVDSGYTGWLTLPPALIAALNLSWRTVGRGILADGSLSVLVQRELEVCLRGVSCWCFRCLWDYIVATSGWPSRAAWR